MASSRPVFRRYRQPVQTGPNQSTWTPEQKAAHKQAELLKTPVAEMKLPVRVINTLEDHDVILVSELMVQTHESLMGMKNFGDKTLREVRAAITSLGLTAPEWKKPPKPKKPPMPKGKVRSVIDLW